MAGRKDVVIRGAGVLIVAGVLAGGGSYIVTEGGGSEPTANLWVDTDGGTCVDNASPVEYATATACGTFDAANDTCEGGDTVRVKTGTYSGQTIRGTNSRSSACAWTFEATVLVNGRLNFGSWHSGGCTFGSSSLSVAWVTLTGPFEVRGFDADCTNQFTVTGPSRGQGMDVDCNGADMRTTHSINTAEGAANFTIRNSLLHNCLNGDGHWWSGGDDHVIEYNDIYNLGNDTGGAVHDEALRITGNDGLIARGNHFWGNSLYNTFLTGSSTATDQLWENNIFERPTGGGSLCFAFRGGGEPSPNPDGFTFQYNTFGTGCGIQFDDSENQTTANGMIVRGNIFGSAGYTCGATNTTYSYNLAPTGTSNCGGTGAQAAAAATINAAFVDPRTVTEGHDDLTTPPGDYHLDTASGPACNLGNGSVYPSFDFEAEARFLDSAPEIGADEYAGCTP